MKTTGWVLCTLVPLILFFACNKDSENTTSYYDYMHFERAGGGQIEFNLFSTENIDIINAMVTKYNFQDTTIQISLEKNSDNASAFMAFQNALNNQVHLNGNFEQPTEPTGTWVFIYFICDSEETEVTNTDLRNSLLPFEQLVRDQIEDKR